MSHLREHIFKHSFQDCLNPLCFCGDDNETFNHYLLDYPTYTNKRMTLLHNIKNINCDILELKDNIMIKIILFWLTSLSVSSNTLILNSIFMLYLPKDLMTVLTHGYKTKKHYLAFLLAFSLFYFWINLVYLILLTLV